MNKEGAMKRVDYKNNKGFTLVEIIIVLLVIGLIGLAVYPVLSSATNIFFNVRDTTDIGADAVNFFEYMDQKMQDNAVMVSTGNYTFTFRSGADTYQVLLADYPGGTAPYDLVITKNGAGQNILLKNVAGSGGVPAFDLRYLDRDGEIASVTGNIKTIEAIVTFAAIYVDRKFSFAWSLGKTITELP